MLKIVSDLKKLSVSYKLCFIIILPNLCFAGLALKSGNNVHLVNDENNIENNASSNGTQLNDISYYSTQTNVTTSANAFRISPTVWVLFAILLLISSGCTFVYIAISKLKAEHKKRMMKSKVDSMQMTNVQNDDLEEDMIFRDEFNIVPRGGSFIGEIFRQISHKKTTTTTTTTDT